MPRLSKEAKQQSPAKAPRNPKCARCRNHGFIVQLKGHSGRCQFQHCVCWKCALITERTKIMAFQRRIKRSQAEEAQPGEPAGAQPEEDAPQQGAAHAEPQGPGAGQAAQQAPTPDVRAARTNAEDLHPWASPWLPNKDSAFLNRPSRFPSDYVIADLSQRERYPGDLLTMPIPVKLYPCYGNPCACQALLLNVPAAGADPVPGLPHFQAAGVPYTPEDCRVPLFAPPLMPHVGVQEELATQHLPFTGLHKDRDKRTGTHSYDIQGREVISVENDSSSKDSL